MTETMTETKFVSRYDQRVLLVQQTLQAHSDLSEQAAFDLAVHVLKALDHIPEPAR